MTSDPPTVLKIHTPGRQARKGSTNCLRLVTRLKIALGLAILTNRPFGSVNAYLSGHVLLDDARGTQSTYHLQAEHVTIYLRESDIHLIRYALLDL